MISVCMAYYNRPEALKKTLASYEKWYSHLKLEIVICDDGSDPPLLQLDTPFDYRILHLPKSEPLNPCVPLNKAIRNATGNMIVITNPEDEHKEPALYEMLSLWQHEKDYVTAPCFDKKRGWLTDIDYPLPMPENAHFHFCALLHKNLFPGFDEDYRFGQAFDDNDFLWRLFDNGALFKHSKIPVHHNHVKTDWKLGTQQNYELLVQKWPSIFSQ